MRFDESRIKAFERFVTSFLNPCHGSWINDTHIKLLFLDKSLVEVLELSLIDIGLVLWFNLLLHQLFNVEILEEWMLQYLFDASSGTDSLRFSFLQKLGDEVLSILGDEDLVLLWNWESHAGLFDEEVHSMFIFVEEWWNTYEHFVE